MSVSATVGYLVEDRLRLELSADQAQAGSNSFYQTFDRSGDLRVGLVYDFSGSLSAPGLVATQGLTPGSFGP